MRGEGVKREDRERVEEGGRKREGSKRNLLVRTL